MLDGQEDASPVVVFVVVFVLSVQPETMKAEQMELSTEIHAEIARLSQEGDAQADLGNFGDAIARYVRALELLPPPITDWEAATWLITAIGDAYFRAGAFEQARDALTDAMHYPGAIGNPFIHLRLGQARFELADLPGANDELARAYMAAGEDIFEDEDPKYFAHLKTVLLPPADGAW